MFFGEISDECLGIVYELSQSHRSLKIIALIPVCWIFRKPKTKDNERKLI